MKREALLFVSMLTVALAYGQKDFVKGADVGWLTEQESRGEKFFDVEGNEMDCLELLQTYQLNAVRLRVWVDPRNGWCGKEDVLKKALRAKKLGMDIMIDFHYSDWWADPGKQPITGIVDGTFLSQDETRLSSPQQKMC
jgi:Arabinogalactan endo-1,4-beta-galactosidase